MATVALRAAVAVVCVLLLMHMVDAVQTLPTCADVFDCHRDGHLCVVGDDDDATTTPHLHASHRPPPLAVSPADGVGHRFCVLPTSDAGYTAGRRPRRAPRLEESVLMLVGHSEAPLHAPLHAPYKAFFQNMTDSYLSWHQEARVPASIEGLEEDDVFDANVESSTSAKTHTPTTARPHLYMLDACRRLASRLVRRASLLNAQIRCYPWRNLAAIERLFFRRQTRLQYRIASLTVSDALNERDAEAEAVKYMDGADASTVNTAALFSLGSLRGLRVVSFPATPLFVPANDATAPPSASTSSSSSSIPRLPPSSASIMYTCDFRTVRAAEQHLAESDSFADRHTSDGFSAAEAELLSDLAEAEYDRADVFSDHDLSSRRGGDAARGTASSSSRRKRFSIMAYLLSSWFPGTFSRGARSGAAAPSRRSPSQRAAAAYLAAVHEELGPFQPSRSLLPNTLKQLLGTQTVDAHQQLRITSSSSSARGARRRERRVSYDFVFTISLPSTRSTCLAVSLSPIADVARLTAAAAASPRVSTTSSDDEKQVDDDGSTNTGVRTRVPVHVSEELIFDWMWLKLLIGFRFLTWMHPRVQDSRLLRAVTAGLCGALILFVFLVFYVVRHLQKMSVGKVGLVVAVTMGGVAAFAEGLASVVQYFLFTLQDQLTSEVWVYIGVALLCVSILSSLVVQWLFSEVALQRGGRLGLRLVAALVLLMAYQRNREATCVTLVATRVLVRPRVWYRFLLWGSGAGRVDNAHADPVESVPSWARQEVRYTTPLTAEGQRYTTLARPRRKARKAAQTAGSDGSEEENENLALSASMTTMRVQQKMRLYEEEGARHTRLALEELAAHLRAHPDRYVDRVKDPNRLYRWAGCVQHDGSDGDDVNDEELDEEETVGSEDERFSLSP